MLQEPDFKPSELKVLKTKFDKIKQGISVSQQERQAKRAYVQGLVEQIIVQMKEQEPLFKKMYVELKYTGSSFDNLRISNADEFDMNLVLGLPVRRDKIRLSEGQRGSLSNYAVLSVDFSKEDPLVNLDPGMRGRFGKLLDQNAVHPRLVRNWIQSVLKKACNQFNSRNYQFIFSQSGPAWTLKIAYPNQRETVDVDLVPVFRFEPRTWQEKDPSFRHQIVNRVIEARRRMYLVPKEHSGGYADHWRKHFPEVEEELLNGRMAAKPVIRIMKLLRDNCRWERVASYFIKTLVLLEVDQHHTDVGYWRDSELPVLVFRMMAKLGNCFHDQRLPHLLYRDVNLFSGLRSEELRNVYKNMARILRKIVLDLNYVDVIFSLPSSARLETSIFDNDDDNEEDEQATSGSWCAIL